MKIEEIEKRYRKIQYAREILGLVRKYIDPNAFIAGGFALALYLEMDFDKDIDIFFSSPNFDMGMDSSAYNQLELIFGDNLKVANRLTYAYNKRFNRIGKLNSEFNVDFIQISKAPKCRHKTMEYVFEKFDINLCKIALILTSNNSIFYNNDFIDEQVKNKELVIEYNIADRKLENDIQNAVTEKRQNKYEKRFPDFKVRKEK